MPKVLKLPKRKSVNVHVDLELRVSEAEGAALDKIHDYLLNCVTMKRWEALSIVVHVAKGR